MRFDSKNNFAPPTILLGLLLCRWNWDFFFIFYFFGGIQHSVHGCKAASCNFGVHTGEDEHMTFYSSVLFVDVLFIIEDWKEKAGS